MKIETKFDIDQLVYVIENNPECINVQCEVCQGEGKVVLSEKRWRCPACYGLRKTTKQLEDRWRVRELVQINKITIEFDYVSGENPKIEYSVGEPSEMDRWTEEEQNLFKTTAEAEAECSRRNGKETRQ